MQGLDGGFECDAHLPDGLEIKNPLAPLCVPMSEIGLINRPRPGLDKDRADYAIYSGEWCVGRIYQTRGGPIVCAGSGR
jgi:hypothetical protein